MFKDSSRISFQTQLLTPEVITLGLNFSTHGLPEPQCPNRICCPIDLSPLLAGKFCTFTDLVGMSYWYVVVDTGHSFIKFF